MTAEQAALLYPEHTKLKAAESIRTHLAIFLDQLEADGRFEHRPSNQEKADWIGKYLNIDPVKLEAEKTAMLAYLRREGQSR